MLGDDGKTLQKQKSVMRWDAKKKKYLPVMISADGKALKEHNAKNRKNESGKKVSGSAEQSDLYAKWAKNTKKRVQTVGELENGGSWAGLPNLGADSTGADGGADGDDNDDTTDGVTGTTLKGKPIVPFHGDVDAKFLTNKQKRRLEKQKKQAANPITSRGTLKDAGSIGGITRGAAAIRREKKKEQDKKMKNDKSFRKKRVQELKDQYKQKQAERLMAKQTRPRSFNIWVGGKKDAASKKLAKRAKVKKGPTFV